ncbi:MAG: hypothetical protein L6R39_002971 [Caloplaca ligustica]|nr:MAG: hypothetical protein L6R39_002971 [Caloplaca ligustica]
MYSKFEWARLQRFWQRIMLWTLQHDHRKALTLLEATISDPHNRAGATRYAIEDALEFLASKHLQCPTADLKMKDRLHRLLCRFAGASNLGDNRVSSSIQKVVYLLLRHSDKVQAEVLYEALVNSRVKLHPDSLTHFMDRFARIGRPDMALDALKRIAVSPADILSDAVQYSCVTLLRVPFGGAERYRIQSHVVTEMLELGIRPGIPMLNAMILNAVESADYQTAYAIFETARTHGIRRDTVTYSTLLKVALHNLDESLVKRIMSIAEEDGALPRNNQLVFCLVATIMQIARAENATASSGGSRYRTMLQIYSRYCDTGPLQELGIYINLHEDFRCSGPISQPSPQLLSVMILGYIQLFGQPSLIQELYHRWQHYLAQNNPLIAPTAGTDHLANAFLFSLGQNRATFTLCPTILRNMLEPPASTTVKVARPTVQTWSILLRSYFFNGQRAAGEKIIEMMRERGIKPNIVTINTIIAGYAKLQDAGAAVSTMQQMEAAGFQADSSTYKGLTRVIERNQLLEALRKAAVKVGDSLGGSQATKGSTKAGTAISRESKMPKGSTVGGALLREAPRSDHYISSGGATQQNEQGTVDGVLNQSVPNSPRDSSLQQTIDQQSQDREKEASSDIEKFTSPSVNSEKGGSYLYQICDTVVAPQLRV